VSFQKSHLFSVVRQQNFSLYYQQQKKTASFHLLCDSKKEFATTLRKKAVIHALGKYILHK
jgi:hypothetical protein